MTWAIYFDAEAAISMNFCKLVGGLDWLAGILLWGGNEREPMFCFVKRMKQRHNVNMNKRITFNPKQCGGRPCIRGMRIRVKDVLDLLAAGLVEKEILEDYPYLEAEDIAACLEYAAAEADHPVLVAE